MLARHVVDEDILAEPLRSNDERSAIVDFRALCDELSQIRPAVEGYFNWS